MTPDNKSEAPEWIGREQLRRKAGAVIQEFYGYKSIESVTESLKSLFANFAEDYADVVKRSHEEKVRAEEKERYKRYEKYHYLKFGLFNEVEELVMATESGQKAHEIAKTYDLRVQELY